MIKFKSSRIHDEFNTLKNENTYLYNILQSIGTFLEARFNKDVMITCLYRTADENAALYKLGKEPTFRPHTTWEAVDLRSYIYTEDEISTLLEFCKSFIVWENKKKAAVYHKIDGNVFHLHIQANRADSTWS